MMRRHPAAPLVLKPALSTELVRTLGNMPSPKSVV